MPDSTAPGRANRQDRYILLRTTPLCRPGNKTADTARQLPDDTKLRQTPPRIARVAQGPHIAPCHTPNIRHRCRAKAVRVTSPLISSRRHPWQTPLIRCAVLVDTARHSGNGPQSNSILDHAYALLEHPIREIAWRRLSTPGIIPADRAKAPMPTRQAHFAQKTDDDESARYAVRHTARRVVGETKASSIFGLLRRYLAIDGKASSTRYVPALRL